MSLFPWNIARVERPTDQLFTVKVVLDDGQSILIHAENYRRADELEAIMRNAAGVEIDCG